MCGHQKDSDVWPSKNIIRSVWKWRREGWREIYQNRTDGYRREEEKKRVKGRIAHHGIESKREGKYLVLLQVNCRSIYSTALEIWNLVDTYNPDIIIGTVSWLSEDIGNTELFREDFKTFRRDRHTPGGGVLFVSKIILTALSYGLMMILR